MATPSIWYKLNTIADITKNYGSFPSDPFLVGSTWNIVDNAPYPRLGKSAAPVSTNNYTDLGSYQYLTGYKKPWSIVMWYKPPTLSGTEQNNAILLFGMNDNYRHIDLEYRNGPGYQYFRHALNGIGYGIRSEQVSANTWVFMVATFDGSSFKFYLDGVDATHQDFSPALGLTIPYVAFFAFRSWDTRVENGYVADFKFYEEALTLEFIQQLYENDKMPLTSQEIVLNGVKLTGLFT
jgi:hypothetical protein